MMLLGRCFSRSGRLALSKFYKFAEGGTNPIGDATTAMISALGNRRRCEPARRISECIFVY